MTSTRRDPADALYNDGAVNLPRMSTLALRVAAIPGSGWAVSNQPTWERARAVAEALAPLAAAHGYRLRIRKSRRSGRWIIHSRDTLERNYDRA